MVYIKLFVDYLDAIEPLGDAERGRLFTALLTYAGTGEAPQLCGNERFLFPMMRAQIDRDEAAAEEISEARSAAGKRGAQAKARKRQQTRQLPAKASKPSYDKDKDKDKDKEKDKDEDSSAAAPSGQSSSGSAVSFFLDKVNPAPAAAALELLADYEQDLGSEVCIRAMMEALDAGKADWRYIQGILRNKRRDGIRSLAAWDAHEAKRKKQTSGKENQNGTNDIPTEYRVGEWL